MRNGRRGSLMGGFWGCWLGFEVVLGVFGVFVLVCLLFFLVSLLILHGFAKGARWFQDVFFFFLI